MSPDRAAPLFTRYGFTRTGDPAVPLEIAPYPEVCANGALRATVVASAVDLVGGFVAREAAGADAIFTTDLSIRIARPAAPKRLLAAAHPLRSGRRLVTTAVELREDASTFAYGETTFLRTPRDADGRDVASLATPETIPFHPLERPLDEEVGVESGERAGVVRLPLRPVLLNPEGVLQGALTALVVECAALSLAGVDRAALPVVSELDLRYLAAASVGPVEGRASWVADAGSGMLRVELSDVGREGRLVASALVRVADAPATRFPEDRQP